MLWLASACVLMVTMGALHHFTAASPLAARATLALGFLLIAAWLGGELAARRRLPRVVGYLCIGLCVGPAWLNLVRVDEVAALQFFADAGIALFAIIAGTELARVARSPERIALARVAGAAMGLPFAAVVLVVLSVSRWFPLTAHQSFGNAVGVALALGAVAAVASPVMSVVAEDARPPGPFARAMIGVAAAQDVALLLVLSLVLLVARPLASPGALNVAAAAGALLRWGGSLAAGGALGFVLAESGVFAGAGGNKEGRAGVTPLVLAIACLLPILGRALEIEPLLVALAAGFAAYWRGLDLGATVGRVLNWDGVQGPGGEAVQPVTAACFGIAGAGLQFGALEDLWPWVVLLVCLRATALRHGLRWVGERAGVMPALAREGWLGLISQSGAALGLGPLVRRAFPAFGVSLEALILATIAIHEVAGPVCFQRALARAAALKEEADVGEGAAIDGVIGAPGSGVR
ncbi:MAG TPA: cation:proton antiporter [Gemmatimonadales bacterium]|nr:cation:proton antiporter [Gemmatimonadales bacterium]